jgi:type II secretion system protein L
MTVGVEVSAGMLRAVRMDRFRPGEAPESVSDISYTPTAPGGVPPAEAISTLMRRVGAVDDAVAVAVPSSWCFYREVSFPYRAARRVESTLTYALDGRLPGKIEGYVIEPLTDIHPAGVAGSQLLVAACPSERLKDLLAEFRSAGIEPCIVQPAIVSAARLVSGVEETLLVRLAGSELEVAFLRDGEVVACEVIRYAEARNSELPDARALAGKVCSAVRAYEVSHGQEISFLRIALLVPESIRAALSAELQAALELPAAPAGDLADDSRCPAAALGAAAEAVERKHLAVNLRAGEFAYAPYARRIERRVVAALALATAVVALLGVSLLRRTLDAEKAIAADSRREAALYAEVTGIHGVPNIKVTEAAVAKARKEINRADRLRMVSCLTRWADLMKLVPANGNVTLDTLDIGQDRMVVSGRAKDSDAAFAFRANVQASNTFQPDAPVVTRNPGSSDSTYSMELRYR